VNVVSRGAMAIGLLCLSMTAACVDTLPDQDLRIVSAIPSAKISADILWQAYQADRKSADRTYRTKAILITGIVTSVDADAAAPTVTFGQAPKAGIEAHLLLDSAAQVVTGLTAGNRITLKCFCEGLGKTGPDLMLKSCVRP
jgi:hypothetical protein